MQQRLGGSRNHANSSAYCVCEQCGVSMRHVPGVPCNSRTCPQCGQALHKSFEDAMAANLTQVEREEEADFELPKTERKILFPVVNELKCTGCGSCTEVCPAECISLKNGIAFVEESSCRNCRICISYCPEDAFEVK